jgi:hypothetical protein
MIFQNARFRITHKAQYLVADVFFSADKIVQLIPNRVPKKSIGGKISPKSVFFFVRKKHGIRPPTIAVGTVVTECGDLEMMSVFFYEDNAKVFANGIAFFKDVLYFFWLGIGGDVDIV